jgi:hypothetical protein
MRSLLVLLLVIITIPSYAQNAVSKATFTRIFVSIPDSCFISLAKQQPDSVVIDKKLRRELMDSSEVKRSSEIFLYFHALDTLHGYLRLISKAGDPEGMYTDIACWDRTDGTRLVIMTVNYDDMCVSEQRARYFWIDNGTTLSPVNENEVLPPVAAGDCISASFLRKHKISKNAPVPNEITLNHDGKFIMFGPQFDYLFSCGESFEEDTWYGLDGKDITRRAITLSWNGTRFTK